MDVADIERDDRAAMLAATALGLACTSGCTPGNIETLVALAEHDTAALLEARSAVLGIAITSQLMRHDAAAILAAAIASPRARTTVGARGGGLLFG
jgi:hypothetical protein